MRVVSAAGKKGGGAHLRAKVGEGEDDHRHEHRIDEVHGREALEHRELLALL